MILHCTVIAMVLAPTLVKALELNAPCRLNTAKASWLETMVASGM